MIQYPLFWNKPLIYYHLPFDCDHHKWIQSYWYSFTHQFPNSVYCSSYYTVQDSLHVGLTETFSTPPIPCILLLSPPCVGELVSMRHCGSLNILPLNSCKIILTSWIFYPPPTHLSGKTQFDRHIHPGIPLRWVLHKLDFCYHILWYVQKVAQMTSIERLGACIFFPCNFFKYTVYTYISSAYAVAT